MNHKYELKEPNVRTVFKKAQSVQSRIGAVRKRSEVDHTDINIISHIEDFEALEQEWNELAEESNTHIFQTFDWNRIWWKHFGINKKLHIITVYTGNKLAGIAPLFEDDVTLLGRKVYSCLRYLGSYVNQPEGEPLMGSISYSDYLDCIIHPGYEKIFFKQIHKYFSEESANFDEIILNEVSEESTLFNTLIPLIEKSNNGLSYKIDQSSCSPVIQLDSTWEAYLNSLNVKDRYNARRYFKRSKQGKKQVFNIEKIEHAGELPDVLEDLLRMHQQQWNSRGFDGTFSEQRMRDFFIEIAKSFYNKNWLEFNMAVPVEKERKNVAIDVILTYKNRIYLMHRGMDENPLYRKQGPGNVLLFARMNEAINDGVKVFDLLRGSEEFKLRMATKINQNNKITVSSGFKSGRVMPGLVKITLKIFRHIRTEKSQIKHVFNDKSIFKGITDYIQFLHRRFKYKFFN